MNDFLNPKSMTDTWGVWRGCDDYVTNSLASQFDLDTAWTGILLSFLFGSIVFAAGNMNACRSITLLCS